jgi:hypothetical protein
MRALSVLVTLTLLAAGPAAAQSLSGQSPWNKYGWQVSVLNTDYCLVGAIRTCASIRLETTPIAGGGTAVRMYVRNLQGTLGMDNTGGSLITEVGVTGVSVGATTLNPPVSGPVGSGSPAGYWSVQTNNWGTVPKPIGGPVALNIGVRNNVGGILGCDPSDANPSDYFKTCGAGSGWVVFDFTTANRWAATDPGVGVVWGIRSAAVDGNSYQCRTGDAPGSEHYCEVIPEPVTMVLLGTGLAGIGGVALYRRRRGLKLESH